MKPAVSVVTAAYNPGAFLAKSIESIVAQAGMRWEMVVVDDGSDEDLSCIERIDERVRCIKQKNAGSAAARNRGIEMAQGEFVAFLDADDLWLPGKLSKQLSLMRRRPEVGLSYTGFRVIDERGQVTGDGFGAEVHSLNDLVRGSKVLTSTVVVRRKVFDQVGMFDESLRRAQDWDLFLRIAERFPLAYIEEPLVLYRSHASSATRNYQLTYRCARRVVARYLRRGREQSDIHLADAASYSLKRLKDSYGAIGFNAARAAARDGCYWQCTKNLLFAVRLNPGLVSRSLSKSVVQSLKKNTRSSGRDQGVD